jgi:transmembrane 9 superfamily protein 2/4
MIVCYVLFGGISGYVSARVYKLCGGQTWRQNVLYTCLLIPGILFGIVLTLNFLLIGKGSSAAIPFGTLFTLFALWIFLSIPLSLFGAYLGFKAPKIQVPVRTLQIPRQVPDQVINN